MASNSDFENRQPRRFLRSNSHRSHEEPSPQKLFYSIRKEILDATESSYLTFGPISPETGLQLAASFAEDPHIERALPRISYNSVSLELTAQVMPSPVHNSPLNWLVRELDMMKETNFLTSAEKAYLKFNSGNTVQGFRAPYTFSSKEPDACLTLRTARFPTVVVESAYSESWPRLHQDKDLWLLGGAPAINLVFLIRWSKVTGQRIKGDIELHGRDAAGNAILLQTEPIFPAPTANPNQALTVTRAQLFGPAIFPGRNPGDSYGFSISNLRAEADEEIRNMGCTPT